MITIKSDIVLTGTVWTEVINGLQPDVISTKYGIYKLCIAIGIAYDRQLEFEESDLKNAIPRNILINHLSELEMLFQIAILTTELVKLDVDTRMQLAFGCDDVKHFNKIDFLTQFANYGSSILSAVLSDDLTETMRKLKDLVESIYMPKDLLAEMI